MFSGLDGSRQSLDWLPSKLADALRDDARGETEPMFPFDNRKRNAIVGNQMIIATISLLNNLRAPLTIFLAIRAIGIFTVKRMLTRWACPHIDVEGEETCLPFRAYRNPASAISRERSDVGIGATLLHLIPDAIFRSSSQSVRFVAHAHSILLRYTNCNIGIIH